MNIANVPLRQPWNAANKCLVTVSAIASLVAIGVGRILQRGPLGDFSKFFAGGAKSGEICFFPLITKKTTFFAKNFKIQGAFSPPAPC